MPVGYKSPYYRSSCAACASGHCAGNCGCGKSCQEDCQDCAGHYEHGSRSCAAEDLRGPCRYGVRLLVAKVIRSGLESRSALQARCRRLFAAGLREWPRCRYDGTIEIELEFEDSRIEVEAYAVCPRCRRM